MTKKRIIKIIIALILLVGIIAAYVLFLSKPQVTVKSVTVESLNLYTQPGQIGYIEGHDPVDSIKYYIERNRVYGDNDVQVFIEGDELPSNDPNDYAKVTMELEIKNKSIFDSYCNYIMVNGGEGLYELNFVSSPNIEPYVANRLSTTKEYVFEFYIYTKGKSSKEIEDLIRNIELQFPFHNDILKNSNQYFNVDDNDDVVFFFKGIQ